MKWMNQNQLAELFGHLQTKYLAAHYMRFINYELEQNSVVK